MIDIIEVALAYVAPQHRSAVAALWTLDATLGRIVATTTQPPIGQIRLAWWRDGLVALDDGVVPHEPTLLALRQIAERCPVTGAQLAPLAEAWIHLLDALPHDDATLTAFANGRGDTLFSLTGTLLTEPVAPGPGALWALVDFAARCSDETTRQRCCALAAALPGIKPNGLPKFLRILTRLAESKATAPQRVTAPITRWQLLRAVLR